MVTSLIFVFAVLWAVIYTLFYNNKEDKTVGVWMLAALHLSPWLWQNVLDGTIVYLSTIIAFWILYNHYVVTLNPDKKEFMKDDLF